MIPQDSLAGVGCALLETSNPSFVDNFFFIPEVRQTVLLQLVLGLCTTIAFKLK